MKNYQISFLDKWDSTVEKVMHQGHSKDGAAHGIVCNFSRFSFVIKNDEKDVIGAIHAYTAFGEIYVDDIWLHPSCRRQGLGKKLLDTLYDKFKGRGYSNINLVTSHFQAPDFYTKCGFKKEFVRVNKKNPKLSKTFFVKYFGDDS